MCTRGPIKSCGQGSWVSLLVAVRYPKLVHRIPNSSSWFGATGYPRWVVEVTDTSRLHQRNLNIDVCLRRLCPGHKHGSDLVYARHMPNIENAWTKKNGRKKWPIIFSFLLRQMQEILDSVIVLWRKCMKNLRWHKCYDKEKKLVYINDYLVFFNIKQFRCR